MLRGPSHFHPVTHQPKVLRQLQISRAKRESYIGVGSIKVFDTIFSKDIQNFLFRILGLRFGIAVGIFVKVSQRRGAKDDFDILRHVDGRPVLCNWGQVKTESGTIKDFNGQDGSRLSSADFNALSLINNEYLTWNALKFYISGTEKSMDLMGIKLRSGTLDIRIRNRWYRLTRTYSSMVKVLMPNQRRYFQI